MTDPNLVGGGGVDPAQLSRIDDSAVAAKKPRSLWSDAWRQLRRKPAFVISAVIILFVVLIAIAPGLFSHREAGFSDLTKANQGPSGDAWFGYDNQGYDVYARTIYGTRASLLVGVFATILTVLFGSLVGIMAGYYGRLID
ncbi:MAG: ABC transporter permease, partial [Pseudonocardiaceae bacterium]